MREKDEISTEVVTEVTTEVSVKEEKPINPLKLVIIFIVILLIGFVVYSNKEKIFGLPDPNAPTPINSKPKQDSNETTKELMDYKVYYDDYGFCNDESEKCNKYVVIKTETDNIKILQFYDKKYLLIRDGKLIKLFDFEEDKSYTTNIEAEYYQYEIISNKKDNKLLGFTFLKDKNSYYESYWSYYSLKANKVLYDNKYNDLYATDGEYLSGIIYNCENDDCYFSKVDLLKSDEEKVVMSETNNEKEDMFFDSVYDKNYIYYVLLEGIESAQHIKKVYNKDLKEILSFDYNLKFDSFSVDDNQNIYVLNKKVVSIYDTNGKLIKKIDSYDDIYKVDGKYIIGNKDNNLIFTTKDGDDKTICKLDGKKVYYSAAYVTDENYSKPNGIYFDVVDSSVSKSTVYDYHKDDKEMIDSFKESAEYYKCYYGYSYYYSLETGEVTQEPTQICPGAK